MAGVALAYAGENTRVQALLNDFSKRFPEDTWVKFIYVPTLRSTLALSRKDAAKAIAELEPSGPYETGATPLPLYPIFVRGEAQLSAKRGKEAAESYQKIIDHRCVTINSETGALARLGLARAYALT